MNANIFVYGTLQNNEVVTALTGKTLKKKACRLKNYVISNVTGEHFPGMVESPGSVAQGFVLSDVDKASQEIIDIWEGKQYRKVTVDLEVNGLSARAIAYVWKDKARLDGKWSNEEYRGGHMQECISKCIPKELGDFLR